MRNEKETWVLLGEAYVYGIMDDELDLGNKPAEAKKFYLISLTDIQHRSFMESLLFNVRSDNVW